MQTQPGGCRSDDLKDEIGLDRSRRGYRTSSTALVPGHGFDGALQRLPLTETRYERNIFCIGRIRPGIEDEIVAALFGMYKDPVGLQACIGRIIYLDDDRLSRRQRGINLSQGRITVGTDGQAGAFDLRID